MDVLSRRSNKPGRTPWIGDLGVYLLWALTGVLGILTLASLLSIGIFVLPFAVAALVGAALLTVAPRVRPHCLAGVLVGPAVALAWLGSWMTYASDDAGDHCYREGAGVTCQSSGEVNASGVATDTTPHHPGELATGFQWPHAWPFLATGAFLLLVSIAVFVVAGRCVARPARGGSR